MTKMQCRRGKGCDNSLDQELSDLVTKAIVALPGQALPELLLVGAIHGNALLALAIVATVTAAVAVTAFCWFPEGKRLDTSYLPDQPIQCFHLK